MIRRVISSIKLTKGGNGSGLSTVIYQHLRIPAQKLILTRQLSLFKPLCATDPAKVKEKNETVKIIEDIVSSEVEESETKMNKGARKEEPLSREMNKDRTKEISVETSMKYMKSEAYKSTYGDNNVWVLYRRNHKGQIPPEKTRKVCIRGGKISTGSPCPICRDEYLVLHYKNVDLLKQFISPFNGETLSYKKTNICQVKHFQLLVAIEQAKDRGTITFDIPHREYDYSDYKDSYQ